MIDDFTEVLIQCTVTTDLVLSTIVDFHTELRIPAGTSVPASRGIKMGTCFPQSLLYVFRPTCTVIQSHCSC